MANLPDGQRVVITELGEDPDDALARCLTIEAQPAPDPATLGPDDVLIAVESAQVGWVDLLMTSGQYQHAAKPPYTPGPSVAGSGAGCASMVRQRASASSGSSPSSVMTTR